MRRFGSPRAVIQGLKEKYAEAADRDDVKAIVLTGEISLARPPLPNNENDGLLVCLVTLFMRFFRRIDVSN